VENCRRDMRGLTSLEIRLFDSAEKDQGLGCGSGGGAAYSPEEAEAMEQMADRGLLAREMCPSGEWHWHARITGLGKEVRAIQKLVGG
jgi:hypothetical protein